MRHRERNRHTEIPDNRFGWQKWFAIITAVIFLSLMFGGFLSLFIR